MSVLSATRLVRTCLVAWTVLGLAACTPANPFVGVWLDADGRPVPDGRVEGGGIVLETSVTSGACDWGSATFLDMTWPPGRFESDEYAMRNLRDGTFRSYVRDPERLADRGLFYVDDPLLGEFDADAELPASAVATGFHREGWEIWTSDEEDSLYLVGPERTERWQRATTSIVCPA